MRGNFAKQLTILASVAGLSLGCNQQKFALSPVDDTFGQSVTYNQNVDMLFVVDSSPSMGKHQGLMADQISVLLKAFKKTSLHYQFAVTTMDMGNGGPKGHFLYKPGTTPVLTPNTPNLEAVLADRIRVGENGSSVERGLEAMKSALSDPLASGANSGFMRTPSLLVVVFLSDEEDKSASMDYASYLDQIHPPFDSGDRSWVAQYMGVMPNDPSCQTSAWGFASVGYKYMSLADASGGSSESICDANFQRALTNVQGRILEIMTEYKLSALPDIATLQIFVNGVKLVESNVDGYSYDATRNSIKFHGNAVPAPGSKIRVMFNPSGIKG
jgi:hypothetical protein